MRQNVQKKIDQNLRLNFYFYKSCRKALGYRVTHSITEEKTA